jgi:polo-like kinase 1
MSNNFFMANSSIKPSTPSGMRASSSMNKNRNSINKSEGSHIYVKKWVDYSTKYGLGYLLSNGATGIYFNDSTKMCSDAQMQ